MARTTKSLGRKSPRLKFGKRVSDLDRFEGLTDKDRDRLTAVIKEVDLIGGIGATDLLVITRPADTIKPPTLTAQSVAKALKTATAVTRGATTTGARLADVTDRVAEVLRKNEPGMLPNTAVDVGTRGPSIPLGSRVLEQLVQLAARGRDDSDESVIWDDGINQLVVHLGRIKTAVTAGQVRVDIPVGADGLRATMSVPFAVGTKETVAGTVMSTVDRPAGDALIARIWGDSLIALAHSAIVSASESMAAAAGVDTKNKRLVAGALTAERGRLTVDSVSRRRFEFEAGR